MSYNVDEYMFQAVKKIQHQRENDLLNRLTADYRVGKLDKEVAINNMIGIFEMRLVLQTMEIELKQNKEGVKDE